MLNTCKLLLLPWFGGHCQLIEVRAVGDYEILGTTRDDALGEAFDKTAKMMGLTYPGGPQVEKLALNGDTARFTFPKPLTGQPGCDFSLSGLKTAVRREILAQHEASKLDEQTKADVCASFQSTVAAILDDRIGHAATAFTAKHGTGKALVVAGGVAANQFLRARLTKLAEAQGMTLAAPPISLCTDNGAMIAWAGLERIAAGFPPDALDIAPRARWPLAAKG